jgi:ABC-2 type transport system ATP-binding protein
VVAAYPSRVSFVLPDGLSAALLPALRGARPLEPPDDGPVTIHTDALQQTLTALLSWASQRGIDLHELDARSASLEEAFLSIAAGDPTFADQKREVPA